MNPHDVQDYKYQQSSRRTAQIDNGHSPLRFCTTAIILMSQHQHKSGKMFMPRYRQIGGILFWACLSVCHFHPSQTLTLLIKLKCGILFLASLSVSLSLPSVTNFNLAHKIKTPRPRFFKLHMCTCISMMSTIPTCF